MISGGVDASQKDDRYLRLQRLTWRIFEAFGSLLGIICSAGVLYFHFTEPPKHETWREKVTSAISVEFFVTLFVAMCLIFIGAIAAPKWLEKITAKRALIAIGFLLLWLVVGTLLGVK